MCRLRVNDTIIMPGWFSAWYFTSTTLWVIISDHDIENDTVVENSVLACGHGCPIDQSVAEGILFAKIRYGQMENEPLCV